MIHFCELNGLWKFNSGNHNICLGGKGSTLTVYNQLFINDRLYVLNIKTGELLVNQIDPDMIPKLNCFNFSIVTGDRLCTKINRKITRIHELICNLKTNENWVINHIDGDPTNNKRINLELVTNWFNIVLRKKSSGLPIGINYAGGTSFNTKINMPTTQQQINFGSKYTNYLQNLHYQFGTKSGLVTSERYLQAVPNWLPDNSIEFTSAHQIRLDMLIKAHMENQAKWNKPHPIY